MKKRRKKPAGQAALNAAEAAILARTMFPRHEVAQARSESDLGAQYLRKTLAEIRDAALIGETHLRLCGSHAFDGAHGRIVANALKGLGYRVHGEELAFGAPLYVVIRWDQKPAGKVAGAWWTFLNRFWRDSL